MRPRDPSNEFTEAVKQKYASEVIAGVYNVRFDNSDDTIKISGKAVEEVGFDKIRRQLANLKQLRIVVVDNLRIKSIGGDLISAQKPTTFQTSEIGGLLPNVSELDVSRNLFETWNEVAEICQRLPRLTSVRADGNKFSNVNTIFDRELEGNPFSRIKILSLDDTLLKWTEVAAIAAMLPTLTTLSANGNQYVELENVRLPASIESLSLERNEFQTLQSVRTTNRLNNIRHLSLRENPMASATNKELPPDLSRSFTFPLSLVELELPYCSISDWSLIDALGRFFPGLTSLRVSHNPLFDTLSGPDGKPLTADDGYMLTVARLAQLTKLNFSNITPKERLNAELYYLSQIRLELSLAPHERAPQIILSHPRYPELCRLYGEAENEAKTRPFHNVNPRSLAAALAIVTFRLDIDCTRDLPAETARLLDRVGGDPWTCELPRSYNVYKLIGLAARHYSLKPLSVQLELECPEDDTSLRGAESYPSSDSNDDGNTNGSYEVSVIETRHSTLPLNPLTRSLDTWVDGREATIWVCRRGRVNV